MLSMLDLERFRKTPLTREPFEFLIVPEFVKATARAEVDRIAREVLTNPVIEEYTFHLEE